MILKNAHFIRVLLVEKPVETVENMIYIMCNLFPFSVFMLTVFLW